MDSGQQGINGVKRPRESNTKLTGRWMILARVAWSTMAFLNAAVFVAAIPARMEELVHGDAYQFSDALSQLGLSREWFAFYGTGLDTFVTLMLFLIAFIIFWRRSDDWMAMLVSLALITFTSTLLPMSVALARFQPAWTLPLLAMRALGSLLEVMALYLFPSGEFVPRMTRWLPVAWLVLVCSFFIFRPFTLPFSFAEIRTERDIILFLIIFGWFGSGAFAQIYRYHRVSAPVERQQIKWVVAGFTAMVFGLGLALLPTIIFPSVRTPGVDNLIYTLLVIPVALTALLLVPISIGISILRYHLWDIDIIIRRTLIYGALTATLALVYFASVVVLQGLFRAVTGQSAEIGIILSTLGIAALFAPMRRQIQELIDRRFYRRKYDAEQVLAAFGAMVRDEVDLNKLTDELLGVVDETMQPAQVSLWLKNPERRLNR